ncbi:MAG: hypothetical protein JWM11_4976 [Planctomycetaceae bacterium]|nr:hypothetical protein [Planctomycetaceae bacterium]
MAFVQLERFNLEFACATALGLYSILKQCCFELVIALLAAEYGGKQWHETLNSMRKSQG